MSPLVDLIHRVTAPVPGALRSRLRRLATRTTGDEDQLAETSWGRFKVRSQDTRLLGPYCPEPLETAIVARAVEAGDVAVDIGSNLGWYTNLLAQRVGPRGRVISVEASPHLASRLVEQSRLNGTEDRVRVIEAAVATNSGQVRFVEGQSSEFNHLLGPSETTTSQALLVEAVTFTQIAVMAPREPTFVKIDVGGMEPVVLQSILRWLGSGVSPPILMFGVDQESYARYGQDVGRTMSLLRNHYVLFDVHTQSGRLVQLESGSKPEGRNAIAAPLGRGDQLIRLVHG